MNEELTFQIMDWRHSHKDNDDNSEEVYYIQLFGRDANNKSVYVEVTGFEPYFYVEIPESWGEDKVDNLHKYMQRRVYYKFKESTLKYKIVKKHKFWGFTNDKYFKFVMFKCKNYDAMKAYARLLENPISDFTLGTNIELKLYESNIDPLLRFMHTQNLSACGWATVKNYKELEDSINCDINITAKFSDVVPCTGRDVEIQPFIIAAFDIECVSEDGSFPRAERDGDKIIMIATTFSKYGEDDCYYRHIAVLNGCNPVEGADVVSCKTEKELLIEWSKMIRKQDPDFITGWNIFGFDEKYIYERCKKFDVIPRVSKLGKLKDLQSEWVEKELKSSALGDNLLYFFDMVGRVHFDLMKLVQKDYKLSSYKLDYVSSYFFRGKVKNYAIQEHSTIIETDSVIGIKAGQYTTIIYNDGVADYEHMNGKKFKIVQLTKNSITVDGEIDTSILNKKYQIFWCQIKDDVKPKEIFTKFYGSNKDRTELAQYNIQDCELCNKLTSRLQVVVDTISMANVSNVPAYYLFIRGQGVKIFSLVSKACRLHEYLIPVIKKEDDKNWTRIYGFVKEWYEHTKEKRSKDLSQVLNNDMFVKDDIKNEYAVWAHHKSKSDREFIEEHIPTLSNLEKWCQTQKDSKLRLPDEKKTNLEEIEGWQWNASKKKSIIDFTKKHHIITEYQENDDEDDEKSMDENYVDINYDADGFEGAIVFPAKKTVFLSPISVLDYNSLYPNSMRFKNLSHESIVLDEQYMNLPDYEYSTIIYDNLSKTKTTKCIFAKKKDGTPAIIPSILGDLLSARKQVKNRMENEKDPFRKKILDRMQLALKVVANSLYGQTGASTSPICMKEIAACTTATGRYMLQYSKDFVEVVYKDLIECTQVSEKKLLRHLERAYNSSLKYFKQAVGSLNEPDEENGKYDRLRYRDMYQEELDLLEITHEFPDKKFAGGGNLYTNKQTFCTYFCQFIKELLTGYTINPKIVYGDTDSVFFNMVITEDSTGKALKDKLGLEKSFKLGQMASTVICALLQDPMKQEFEKTMWPLIMLSKKKYVGNTYEHDTEHFYQKNMGVVLKRRDNAQIVKIVCGGIVDQLLNKHDKQGAIKFTRKVLKDMIDGKYPIDKFTITKTLRSDYKNRNSIAHAVLADRMSWRDPGNKPMSNDRIPYAYIVMDERYKKELNEYKDYERKQKKQFDKMHVHEEDVDNAFSLMQKPKMNTDKKTSGKIEKDLQGDKIETPEFIIKNNLKIDYKFYITNQIMKPALQFLELIANNAESIFQEAIDYEKNKSTGCVNMKPTKAITDFCLN